MRFLFSYFFVVATLFASNSKIINLLNGTSHNPYPILSKVAKSWSDSKYINKFEARFDIDRQGKFKSYLPNKLKNSDGMLIGSKGEFWIYKNPQETCLNWKNIVEKNGIKLNKAYPNICKEKNKIGATAIVLKTAIGDKNFAHGFWYLARLDVKKNKTLLLTDFQGTGKWYIPTESPKSVKEKKAFSEAVYSNNTKKMKTILLSGTEIDINKMYLLAMDVSNLDTVKFLLNNGAQLNYKTSSGNPASIASCDDTNIEKAKYLLSLGYNYKQIYLKDKSPIYAAAQCRQANFIDFWLKKGIDINLEKSNGRTPLFDVCRNRKNIFAGVKYAETLKLLKRMIAKGADPTHKDKKNATILHIIAEYGTPEQVKYVKSYFKDINIQDNFHQTPLHYAVREIPYDMKQEKYEIAKYLITVGVDKKQKDKIGRTAYDIVKKMHFPEKRMLKLLKP